MLSFNLHASDPMFFSLLGSMYVVPTNFIGNGSDALLPMNQTIERTNKACLDYIKSTFGGICIKKLRECQNVLNNQFKRNLGTFLQGG